MTGIESAAQIVQENFDSDTSVIRDVYILLGAKTPSELYLLINDKKEEAEEWAETIDHDSVEFKTAQQLIHNYTEGGVLNIVS